MLSLYIKIFAYINLLIIFFIAVYIVFSKEKGGEQTLEEKFSRKYYLKGPPTKKI